jgi:hypothetical protein
MKIKLTTKRLISIIIIGIVALQLFNFIALYFMRGHTYTTTSYGHKDNSVNTIDQLKPIDQVFSTSLPYDRYVKLRDSVREARKEKNGSAAPTNSSFFFPIIGTTGSYLLCDTCTSIFYGPNHDIRREHVQYYIMLPAWKLKDATGDFFLDDSVKFHREHNLSYLRKRLTERTVSGGIYTNHRYEVDVPVKYSYDQFNHCILIPVNKTTKTVASVMVIALGLSLLFYGAYLLICFLTFIVDLSRGKAFTTSNIRSLRLIAMSLLIFPLIVIALAFSTKFIFYQYFTPDVVLNNSTWIDQWKTVVTGIIFLLLYSAFKQGKALKDEQDLTV